MLLGAATHCAAEEEENDPTEQLLELLASGVLGNSGREFRSPIGVTTDTLGRIFILDSDVGIYRLQDRNGGFPEVYEYFSGLPFLEINHRAVDAEVDSANRIHLVDDFLDEAAVFRVNDLDGSGLVSYSGPGGNPLDEPRGIALDSAGRIYYSSDNFGDEGVYRVDDIAGSNFQYYDPGIITPGDVQIDPSNRIYLVNYGGDEIYRFNDMSGSGQTIYDGGGTGFIEIASIDFDSSGRIYVADASRDVLYRFDDMSGTNQVTYDGSRGTAFRNLTDVHIDSSGTIYVTDALNDLLYSFTDMNGSNQVEYNGVGATAVN
ncbi:MAG: hypothetical protein KDK23_01850 [Leptospiraceae bacterium]|nr:hypothetical protein [Leptospiraceae bacterium]